jgi:integrase
MQSTKSTSKDSWQAYLNSLKPESAKKYSDWTTSFEEFCNKPGQKDVELAQNVLDFFASCHEDGYATSSLWSASSALKSFLLIKHAFKLEEQVPLLKRLFKNWEKEDEVEQSAVFTPEQVEKFLNEAPDDPSYLSIKVATIVGIFGSLRIQELTDFTFQQLNKQGLVYIGEVLRGKGRGPKKMSKFVLDSHLDILDNYLNRFSEENRKQCNGRLLRKLTSKGLESIQVIGKHTIGEFPRKIAEFLKLPNQKDFTGHAFRRTAATILANQGAGLLLIKQAGGWRSDAVAQRYIAESDLPKKEVASKLSSAISSSTVPTTNLLSAAASTNATATALQGSSSTTTNLTIQVDMRNATISGGTVNLFVPGFESALNPKK